MIIIKAPQSQNSFNFREKKILLFKNLVYFKYVF